MAAARPAASCHLSYPLPEFLGRWRLECSVSVSSSGPASYFCVVGWGPGGYSGIQQLEDGRRVALFSMWNRGAVSVEEVRHGPGVLVSTFGGEGTGLKAMAACAWREGELVTFSVSGEPEGEGPAEAWRVSCSFRLRGEEHQMATYRRAGPRPLATSGFYSFVEDWERGPGAEGHAVCRRAEFSDQKLVLEGEKVVRLKEAKFTKVEHGRDKFACEKALGGPVLGPGGFFLSTGGTGAEGEACPSGRCFSC
jgi:hypothetical protein